MLSLAYCGIKCPGCPAFIATRVNNFDRKIEMSKNWSTEEYPLIPEEVEWHK
jgi:hypothetical protein